MRTAWLLAGIVALAAAPSCSSAPADDDGRFESQAAATTGSSGGAGAGGTAAGGSPVGPGPGSGASSSSATTTSGTGGAPCSDSGPEPNDTESTATDLGSIDECDSSGGMVTGTLAGNDEDWYVYHGMDTFSTCQIDAYRSISSDGQAQVCKYVDCDNPTFSCPQGTVSDTSPLGRPGCCSLSPFAFFADCDPIDDSADVYIRVHKPAALACVTYTLQYHF